MQEDVSLILIRRRCADGSVEVEKDATKSNKHVEKDDEEEVTEPVQVALEITDYAA